MTKTFTSLLAAAALLASSSSMAVVLEIDFDTGGPVTEFNLGTFDSGETGTDFYRYSCAPQPNCFNASAAPYYPGTTDLIPLEADALQIFAHLDTNTNELSFGIILEKPNGSGGGSFSAEVVWSAPATLAFTDDPGETGSIGGGSPQNLSLNWANCCTDGFVISGFDPTNLSLSIGNVNFTDLDKVIFLQPNRTVTSFNVQVGEPININILPCDPATDPNGCQIPGSGVPVPGPLALIGLGLAGLGFARRRV